MIIKGIPSKEILLELYNRKDIDSMINPILDDIAAGFGLRHPLYEDDDFIVVGRTTIHTTDFFIRQILGEVKAIMEELGYEVRYITKPSDEDLDLGMATVEVEVGYRWS